MRSELLSLQAANGLAQAQFSPQHGGVGVSLRLPDPARPGQSRELLYQPAGFDWAHYHKIALGWPLCFPICGRLNRNGQANYLYQQRLYSIGIHGFAHSLPWTVIHHTERELTLQLTANDHTRAQYPFEFAITLAYTLDDHALRCTHTYSNHGREPMPYVAGLHPYFWIDPARYDKSQVILSCAAQQRFQYNDTFTDVIGERAPLKLPIAITDPDVNESLLLLGQDRRIRLSFPDHSVIELEAHGEPVADFPYVQLYHVAEQPFFCIEPWMSHPNALNTVAAAPLLPPGVSAKAECVVSLTDGHLSP